MNKRHYEHTLPNIRGSLSNTYSLTYGIKTGSNSKNFKLLCISPAKLFLIDKRRFNYFYLKHCIE